MVLRITDSIPEEVHDIENLRNIEERWWAIYLANNWIEEFDFQIALDFWPDIGTVKDKKE